MAENICESTEFQLQLLTRKMLDKVQAVATVQEFSDYRRLSSDGHFHSKYIQFLARVNMEDRYLMNVMQGGIDVMREVYADYNNRRIIEEGDRETINQVAQDLAYAQSVFKDQQKPLTDLLSKQEADVEQRSTAYWERIETGVQTIGEAAIAVLADSKLDASDVDKDVLSTQDNGRLKKICEDAGVKGEHLAAAGIDLDSGALSAEQYADLVLIVFATEACGAASMGNLSLEQIKQMLKNKTWKKSAKTSFATEVSEAQDDAFFVTDASTHKSFHDKVGKVVSSCKESRRTMSEFPTKDQVSEEAQSHSAAERFDSLLSDDRPKSEMGSQVPSIELKAG